MDRVKNLFAKSVMSVGGVGGDKGGEMMTLKESLVDGIEG